MAEILAPIVIDLGKARRKAVKELMRGRGALLEDIGEALAQVRAGLGADASGKRLLPIVVVYRKRRAGRFLKLPLPF
jgi:hypothetical protein